jgi:hypothetical protein
MCEKAPKSFSGELAGRRLVLHVLRKFNTEHARKGIKDGAEISPTTSRIFISLGEGRTSLSMKQIDTACLLFERFGRFGFTLKLTLRGSGNCWVEASSWEGNGLDLADLMINYYKPIIVHSISYNIAVNPQSWLYDLPPVFHTPMESFCLLSNLNSVECRTPSCSLTPCPRRPML